MVLISAVVTLLYLLLIGSFIFGFNRLKTFNLKDLSSKTKFSIVIPFRNEAENLPGLLRSISALNYPKHLFEIILVDDDSDDNFAEALNVLGFKRDTLTDIAVVSNERTTNAPKKDAIALGIKTAKYEWIITTDADCTLPKYWLDSFDECIQKTDVVCISAPVTYHNKNSFLNRFQLLDLLSLQGATIGAFGLKTPFLCNGANFAYSKEVFNELDGFKGNADIPSGDDVFLLEKIAKACPKKVQYLKSEKSIVTTKAQPTWGALISQRVRWASKTRAYRNWFGKITAITIFLMNLLLIVMLALSAFGFFIIEIWAYILIIKLNIDFLILYKTASFFSQKQTLRSFLIGFLIYPFFSVYVAFLSLFVGYNWKGRDFRA